MGKFNLKEKLILRFRELGVFILGMAFSICVTVLADSYTKLSPSKSLASVADLNEYNVQAVTELSSTTGNLKTKIENHFKNSASGYFDGNALLIPGNNAEITIPNHTSFWYDSTNALGILSTYGTCSSDNTDAWGCGDLDIRSEELTVSSKSVQTTLHKVSRNVGNITINSNGYYQLYSGTVASSYPSPVTPSNLLWVELKTWNSASSPFEVTRDGTYIIANKNTSINGLQLNYVYVE